MTLHTHTPTPWDDDIFRDKMNYCYRIGLPTGTIEVRTDYGDLDAAHIVHCVNTHDALVEALRKMVKVVLSKDTDAASLNCAIANAEHVLDAATDRS